jgi:hypothetical protein
MSNYKIIKRTKIKKKLDWFEENFDSYNFNVPLVGFSDYSEKINKGDVVGVIITSNEKTRTEFTALSPYKYLDIKKTTGEIYGSYQQTEEHFFRVIDINKNNTKFKVKQVFIDNKVIHKKINEHYTREFFINSNEINNFDRLIKILTENFEQYNIVNEYYVFNNLESFWNNIHNNNKIPYKNFKNVIFNIWNKEELKYFEKIIDFWHKKYPEQIKNIGSVQQIIENINIIFDKVKMIDKIKFNISFVYNQDAKLEHAKIKHKISHLKLLDIYRVYKKDFNNFMKVSNTITSRNGTIFSNDIKNFITVGNEVKIAIKSDRCNVSNFTILYKLSPKRFLASLYNTGTNTSEDVIIIIDLDCIFEIPTYVHSNLNLCNYHNFTNIENLDTELALLHEKNKEDLEEKLLPLHYSDLIFN